LCCFNLRFLLSYYNRCPVGLRQRFSMLIVVIMVYCVEYSTATLPYYSVSPTVSCPSSDQLLVFDYYNRANFDFAYPESGDRALRGSGQELVLPNPPYQIVMYTKTSFLQMKFSVRNAESMTTTFSKVDGYTVTTRRRITTGTVSLCSALLLRLLEFVFVRFLGEISNFINTTEIVSPRSDMTFLVSLLRWFAFQSQVL